MYIKQFTTTYFDLHLRNMTIPLVVLAALAPVAWLLWTIYKKDRAQPEPAKWLVKAFVYGVLSAVLSFTISIPIGIVLGMDIDAQTYSSPLEAVADAFLLAAIPEELAKFFMLWLLLRKNPFFDEHFDGIVYTVCIGLGFAALENIIYLLGGIKDWSWVGIGITRAFVSVPAHYFFAILMGYYYSIYHFGKGRSAKTKSMILVAPILAHGIFDSILFSMQTNESLSGLLMIFFIIFFTKLKKVAKEKVDKFKLTS